MWTHQRRKLYLSSKHHHKLHLIWHSLKLCIRILNRATPWLSKIALNLFLTASTSWFKRSRIHPGLLYLHASDWPHVKGNRTLQGALACLRASRKSVVEYFRKVRGSPSLPCQVSSSIHKLTTQKWVRPLVVYYLSDWVSASIMRTTLIWPRATLRISTEAIWTTKCFPSSWTCIGMRKHEWEWIMNTYLESAIWVPRSGHLRYPSQSWLWNKYCRGC